MKEAINKQEIVLASVGLKEVMIEENYSDAFNKELFHIYTPQEYEHSERKEMDEVYRMGEKVLLHKLSGLRIEYITTESYYGDEYKYRVRSIFIITKEQKKIDITDVDFARELYATPDGEISFSEVKMDSNGD